jgi:hypothetical protein
LVLGIIVPAGSLARRGTSVRGATRALTGATPSDPTQTDATAPATARFHHVLPVAMGRDSTVFSIARI